MSHGEIIIGLLKRIHFRQRFNRTLKEGSFALALSLVLPVLIKLSDLIFSFESAVGFIAIGLWIVTFTVLSLWRLRDKLTLAQAAAAVDTRARLHDQMKSAHWFLENSGNSVWIEAQIERTAMTVRQLNINALFPVRLPKGFCGATAMVLIFVSLNFLPMRGNSNWLYPLVSPVSAAAHTNGSQPLNVFQSEPIQSAGGEGINGAGASQQTENETATLNQDSLKPIRQDQLTVEDARELGLALGDGASSVKENAPAGQSGSDAPTDIMGAPTHLEVQLQQENLAGQRNQTSEPMELKPTEKEASKLGYRYSRLGFGPGQNDSLDQNRIPWEYRQLIKDYFDAIVPARTND